MTTLHTTRAVGEAIQKALPGFETRHDVDRFWKELYPNNWKLTNEYDDMRNDRCVNTYNLHDVLSAIRELGKKERWEPIACTPSDVSEACPGYYQEAYLFLERLLAADLDLSHPSVSEYLLKLFNE